MEFVLIFMLGAVVATLGNNKDKRVGDLIIDHRISQQVKSQIPGISGTDLYRTIQYTADLLEMLPGSSFDDLVFSRLDDASLPAPYFTHRLKNSRGKTATFCYDSAGSGDRYMIGFSYQDAQQEKPAHSCR